MSAKNNHQKIERNMFFQANQKLKQQKKQAHRLKVVETAQPAQEGTPGGLHLDGFQVSQKAILENNNNETQANQVNIYGFGTEDKKKESFSNEISVKIANKGFLRKQEQVVKKRSNPIMETGTSTMYEDKEVKYEFRVPMVHREIEEEALSTVRHKSQKILQESARAPQEQAPIQMTTQYKSSQKGTQSQKGRSPLNLDEDEVIKESSSKLVTVLHSIVIGEDVDGHAQQLRTARSPQSKQDSVFGIEILETALEKQAQQIEIEKVQSSKESAKRKKPKKEVVLHYITSPAVDGEDEYQNRTPHLQQRSEISIVENEHDQSSKGSVNQTRARQAQGKNETPTQQAFEKANSPKKMVPLSLKVHRRQSSMESNETPMPKQLITVPKLDKAVESQQSKQTLNQNPSDNKLHPKAQPTSQPNVMIPHVGSISEHETPTIDHYQTREAPIKNKTLGIANQPLGKEYIHKLPNNDLGQELDGSSFGGQLYLQKDYDMTRTSEMTQHIEQPQQTLTGTLQNSAGFYQGDALKKADRNGKRAEAGFNLSMLGNLTVNEECKSNQALINSEHQKLLKLSQKHAEQANQINQLLNGMEVVVEHQSEELRARPVKFAVDHAQDNAKLHSKVRNAADARERGDQKDEIENSQEPGNWETNNEELILNARFSKLALQQQQQTPQIQLTPWLAAPGTHHSTSMDLPSRGPTPIEISFEQSAAGRVAALQGQQGANQRVEQIPARSPRTLKGVGSQSSIKPHEGSAAKSPQQSTFHRDPSGFIETLDKQRHTQKKMVKQTFPKRLNGLAHAIQSKLLLQDVKINEVRQEVTQDSKNMYKIQFDHSFRGKDAGQVGYLTQKVLEKRKQLALKNQNVIEMDLSSQWDPCAGIHPIGVHGSAIRKALVDERASPIKAKAMESTSMAADVKIAVPKLSSPATSSQNVGQTQQAPDQLGAILAGTAAGSNLSLFDLELQQNVNTMPSLPVSSHQKTTGMDTLKMTKQTTLLRRHKASRSNDSHANEDDFTSPVTILERAREAAATRSPKTSTMHMSESRDVSPVPTHPDDLKLPAIETRAKRFRTFERRSKSVFANYPEGESKQFVTENVGVKHVSPKRAKPRASPTAKKSKFGTGRAESLFDTMPIHEILNSNFYDEGRTLRRQETRKKLSVLGEYRQRMDQEMSQFDQKQHARLQMKKNNQKHREKSDTRLHQLVENQKKIDFLQNLLRKPVIDLKSTFGTKSKTRLARIHPGSDRSFTMQQQYSIVGIAEERSDAPGSGFRADSTIGMFSPFHAQGSGEWQFKSEGPKGILDSTEGLGGDDPRSSQQAMAVQIRKAGALQVNAKPNEQTEATKEALNSPMPVPATLDAPHGRLAAVQGEQPKVVKRMETSGYAERACNTLEEPESPTGQMPNQASPAAVPAGASGKKSPFAASKTNSSTKRPANQAIVELVVKEEISSPKRSSSPLERLSQTQNMTTETKKKEKDEAGASQKTLEHQRRTASDYQIKEEKKQKKQPAELNAEALNSDLDLESGKGKKERSQRRTRPAYEDSQKLVSGGRMISENAGQDDKAVMKNAAINQAKPSIGSHKEATEGKDKTKAPQNTKASTRGLKDYMFEEDGDISAGRYGATLENEASATMAGSASLGGADTRALELREPREEAQAKRRAPSHLKGPAQVPGELGREAELQMTKQTLGQITIQTHQREARRNNSISSQILRVNSIPASSLRGDASPPRKLISPRHNLLPINPAQVRARRAQPRAPSPLEHLKLQHHSVNSHEHLDKSLVVTAMQQQYIVKLKAQASTRQGKNHHSRTQPPHHARSPTKAAKVESPNPEASQGAQQPMTKLQMILQYRNQKREYNGFD